MSKRSFNKLPLQLQKQLESLNGKSFNIYAVLKLRKGDELPNLPGLDLSNFENNIPSEVLPDPAKGTWARRNIDGWEIILKDQPKYTKSFSHESPNFGDWSLGSHEVTVDREVYHRDILSGYGSTIKITVLKRDDDSITLSFELDRIFDSIPDDPRELLFAINIFQESVGRTAIKPTDVPAASFLSTLQIDWEILPVGNKEEVIKQIHERLNPSPQEAKVINERMDLLLALRPINLVAGTSGFARYVGALYNEQLVVFENIRYGNAIYIMFNEWERLSKMSRIELMNSDEKFERIVHANNWEYRVRSIVNEYRHSGRSQF
ncbi:MAG TPA: hypothetical protein VK674_04790 [Candidatus Limnocylindria bacterium]|nr:hypothetical protein [Candidatus Limnocylindria bacterium]